MATWIAVPESEDGSWFEDPIGADTEAQIYRLATEQWSGKLPSGVKVAIYACTGMGLLDLPYAETK